MFFGFFWDFNLMVILCIMFRYYVGIGSVNIGKDV